MSIYPCPKPPRTEPKPRKRIARETPVRKRSAKRSRVEKADAAWSKAVRARARGVCEFEACPMLATDAHHVYGKRAHPRLRYDLDNGIALCRESHDAWHAAPVLFREWFGVVYPERLRVLAAKAQREARVGE